MKLDSWGNYPQATGKEIPLQEVAENHSLIAQGNHRSYGDSAFADYIVAMSQYDCMLDFDMKKGVLHCQSGVLLSDILAVIVPKGWILPVLPGTQLITIGGAIASDVHGKNHHKSGTFSEFVTSIEVLQQNNKKVVCNKIKNKDLFHTTCGGMGLTGIILNAKIQLIPIKSNEITQQVIKTKNLKHTFKIFEEHNDATYSVAWIDCFANTEHRGKSVVTIGEPKEQGELSYQFKSTIKLPMFLPAFFINSWFIKLFNALYYAKASETTTDVPMQKYFFPLDAITDWNKMYGKKGFVQYQCVIPEDNSFQAIDDILKHIAAAKQGSFLAVLKRMGKENNNLLSFPLAGYSLALDFKVNKKVFDLLDKLDEIVCKYHGRIYLCKDARMAKETFDKTYKNIQKFKTYRQQNSLSSHFNSQQSQRLGL